MCSFSLAGDAVEINLLSWVLSFLVSICSTSSYLSGDESTSECFKNVFLKSALFVKFFASLTKGCSSSRAWFSIFFAKNALSFFSYNAALSRIFSSVFSPLSLSGEH